MEQCKEIYEKIRFRGGDRKVDREEVPDLEYIVESLAGRHTITASSLTPASASNHLLHVSAAKGIYGNTENASKIFCSASVNSDKSYSFS